MEQSTWPPLNEDGSVKEWPYEPPPAPPSIEPAPVPEGAQAEIAQPVPNEIAPEPPKEG